MDVAMVDMHTPGDDGFWARVRRFLKRFVIDMNPNPTEAWMRRPNLDFILDLDQSTLNGIGFGEPLSALSFLGPADEFMPMVAICVAENGRKLGKAEKSYNASYRADGIGISTDKQFILDSFSISLQPEGDTPAVKAYTGKFVFNGQTMDTAAIDTVDSLLRVFGSPARDEEDPTGRHPYRRHLIYNRPGVMWMIFVDQTTRTQSLFVSETKSSNSKVSDAD